jgi:hypothetical protein
MKALEQAVADTFNDYMRDLCRNAEKAFLPFSLGGQDRDSADYLISNAEGFALIEFKHSELELINEGKKSRRKKLCKLLQVNKAMREIHDKCHFVVWWDSSSQNLRCAPYRTEICNQSVFAGCSFLEAQHPIENRRMLAETYGYEFINPPPERYAQKAEFEKYLAWLMRDASGSSYETVELMARGLIGCTAVRFESVDEAYRWMQGTTGFNFRKPPPDSTREI